jgi:hypothetical protein
MLCESDRQNHKIHVNQLKNVNWQLHGETTFSDLKHNEIKFSTTKIANLPDIPYDMERHRNDMKRYHRERSYLDRPLNEYPEWVTAIDQLITFMSRLWKNQLA